MPRQLLLSIWPKRRLDAIKCLLQLCLRISHQLTDTWTQQCPSSFLQNIGMIFPNGLNNSNKEDDKNVVVEDVKLDVEAEGVRMLEGDDESDFSDDCQMNFDVVKDLWVRKQTKPPWAEVASVRSESY